MRTTPTWQRNRKTSQLNQNGVNEPDGGADGFLTARVLEGTWLCRRQVTVHQALEPTTTRAGDEKANLRKISMDLRQEKEDRRPAGWHEHENESPRGCTSCKILFKIFFYLKIY
ncbi:hypothetical protein Peur_006731 [Populus x canadensis]